MISIVICVYTTERLKDIHEAVNSVFSQTLKPHEVILAVDHNEKLLDILKTELPSQVKLVLNSGAPGLSETRNTGVRASTGEIVAFMDDDAVADIRWLEKLAERFRDPLVVAVGGKAVPRWLDGERPKWFPEELDWIVGCTYKGLPVRANAVRNVLGCNMAFRKAVLEQAVGFRGEVGRVGKFKGVGEEADICLKIKHLIPQALIHYEPEAVVFHKVPSWRVSLRYLAQRSYNEGFYKSIVKKLSSSSASETLSTENTYLRYLLFTAIREKLRNFYRRGAIRQIGAILISVASTGLGYLLGEINWRQTRTGSL